MLHEPTVTPYHCTTNWGVCQSGELDLTHCVMSAGDLPSSSLFGRRTKIASWIVQQNALRGPLPASSVSQDKEGLQASDSYNPSELGPSISTPCDTTALEYCKLHFTIVIAAPGEEDVKDCLERGRKDHALSLMAEQPRLSPQDSSNSRIRIPTLTVHQQLVFHLIVPGHLTRKKTTRLTSSKTARLADAEGSRVCYHVCRQEKKPHAITGSPPLKCC